MVVKKSRAAIEFAVIAILAAAIVVLLLNYLEVDDYPQSLEASTEPDSLPPWMPPILFHPCVWCELCPHRFETAECKLTVTVTDRDGWYRLFWKAPETYTYTDPAHFAAALGRRTAEFGGGSWTIRGRYAPVDKPESHPCPSFVDEVRLSYRLNKGPFPGPAAPTVDSTGRLVVPTRMFWFRYPFPPEGYEEFWWELENPSDFARTARCACGVR
jgi:hypothetical protein